MPRAQVKNFAKATVSTGYNASATSIVLTTGQGAKFPSVFPYYCVWWNVTDFPDPSDDPFAEIVRVDARSTDTLTIVRGQDGTSGSPKNTAGKTYRFMLVFASVYYNEMYENAQSMNGRFVFVSATQCKLETHNGNRIVIEQGAESIPGGGITVSNAGLVANTLYYAYVFMSSGVMTIEFSTTGWAFGALGQFIKTGDNTRTLIGLIRTNALAQFADSATQRFVVSALNQSPRLLRRPLTDPTAFTATGTAVEINSAERIEWVQFSGSLQAQAAGRVSNSTAGAASYINVKLDATIGGDGPTSGGHSTSANNDVGAACVFSFDALEGYHWATVTGVVTAGTGSARSVILSALLP